MATVRHKPGLNVMPEPLDCNLNNKLSIEAKRNHLTVHRLLFLITLALSTSTLAESRGLTIEYRERLSTDAPVAGSMQLYSNSHALVVGIDDYRGGWPRLSNAINDAKRVQGALERRGFDVTLKTNLNSRELETAFEDFFIDKGEDPEARLLVWYAGHGHTLDGEGYLIPADGVLETDARNFKRKSLSLRRFGEFVRLAESKHVYTVFDSCFAGTIFDVARSAPPPVITRVTAAPVRQFLTSGDAGQAVSDDGTFAKLFVEIIEGKRSIPGAADGYITATEMGAFLSDSMANYSYNKQVPKFGKLRDANFDRGDFVFLASLNVPPPVTIAPAPQNSSFSLDDITRQADAEKESRAAWERKQAEMAGAYRQVQQVDGDDIDPALKVTAWQRFQQAFNQDNPYTTADDDMRAQAATRIRLLELEAKRREQQLASLSTPKGGSLSASGKACDVCPEMVLIPAGSFRMGDLNGGGGSDEKPVHRVDVGAFALGKYEVTFNEYDAFARATNRTMPGDQGWGRGTRPVINVSWEDAQAYVKWLSRKTGLSFRLPSESEWEYAARAGTTSKYSFGDSERQLCDYANHADSSTDYNWRNKSCSDGVGKKTAKVGRYKANPFGLYDMHGNVWEWVEDCYNDSYSGAPSDGRAWTAGECEYRVLRGGSWFNEPSYLRSAYRGWHTPDSRLNNYGFRVAQDL